VSRFLRKGFRYIVLAVTFTLLLTNVNAQVSNNQRTPFTSARDFLREFYPDLSGRDGFLGFSTLQRFDASWQRLYKIEFSAMRYDPSSEKILNPPYDANTGKRFPPPENTLLKGGILFDGKGRLHAFEAVGDVVHTKEYDAFIKLLDSHREWSEEDASRELKKAGARFGPAEKSEFIKTFQLEKFGRFMGKLELKSVESEPLPENHSQGNTALGSYQWMVTVDRILASGKRIPYVLRFEPFEGNLTAVHKKGELLGIIQEDE